MWLPTADRYLRKTGSALLPTSSTVRWHSSWALGCVEEITGKPVETLYIVGGGGKNELLNRYTAQAIKRPVRIGASEGTVIGNLLVQAMGLGDVKDLWELRKVVRDSFGDKQYDWDSTQDAQWDAEYERLLALMT